MDFTAHIWLRLMIALESRVPTLLEALGLSGRHLSNNKEILRFAQKNMFFSLNFF